MRLGEALTLLERHPISAGPYPDPTIHPWISVHHQTVRDLTIPPRIPHPPEGSPLCDCRQVFEDSEEARSEVTGYGPTD